MALLRLQCIIGVVGKWCAPAVMATSGSKVVHGWFKSGSKVVPKWVQNGSGVPEYVGLGMSICCSG
eukprot:1035102-Pyramimonas_sp.AAC.1